MNTFLKTMTKAIEMMKQEERGQASNSRQLIYHEHDDVKEHFMCDYFGEHPKYLEWEFRRCYRMNRKLFLEIVEGYSISEDPEEEPIEEEPLEEPKEEG
uniref:Uncharacterized protein n=1 Tax=Tanacetum cinerariifolium TaxID=118510 RepID=A0A6L2K9V7_TANCI|nr:hypothetical protein [Tanacetum cinerariifolium]